MPSRMIDGEAIWTSDKLKRVPEAFRAEFANWLPLAEANGVFEINAGRVWQQVYAYNRTDISVEVVEQIFVAFQKADLLRVWTQNGKQYGWWVGMDKPGRLPSATHQKRYKNLPPFPPKGVRSGGADVLEVAPSADETTIEEESVGLKKNISVVSLQKLGSNISPADKAWGEIAVFGKAYGEDRVLEAFETWVEQQKGRAVAYPLSEFTRTAPAYLTGILKAALADENPQLDELCSDLYMIGQQAFTGKYREALAQLLQSYSADELKAAYQEFSEGRDSFSAKFNPRDFCEGAAKDIIRSRKKTRVLLDQQQSLLRATEQALLEKGAEEEQRAQEAEQEEGSIGLPED